MAGGPLRWHAQAGTHRHPALTSVDGGMAAFALASQNEDIEGRWAKASDGVGEVAEARLGLEKALIIVDRS